MPLRCRHNLGGSLKAASQGACCGLCQKHGPECKAWTWHPASSAPSHFPPLTCFLHGAAGPAIHESGAISGVPTAHFPPPAPPPPPPPEHCPEGSGNYSSAAAACAAFDLPTKIDLMHGFGWRGEDQPTPTVSHAPPT